MIQKIITSSEWLLSRKKKKHKFNAVRCESNGIKFPSKLEKEYYDRLVKSQEMGKISYFLQQVPFRLPGNVKYVVDFMVIRLMDGEYPYVHDHIEYVDVKGKMTPMSILKIKQVEALYPIKVKIVDSKYMKTNYL